MNEEIASKIFDNDLNYIVSVSKMGWVNCDRFMNQNPKEYLVNTPANSTTTSFMALNSSRSLVNGFPKDKNGLREFLKKLCTNSGAQEFFCFGNGPKILVGEIVQTGEEAQKKALEVWKKFRQLRRADGHNFGRSMWPEADVIRRAANKHSKHHAPRPQYIDQAPRALLGLPIGIKFKDSDDPNANELILANGSDRYASPIWIGVTRVWEGDQAKCISVVLATEAKLPCDVVIKNHRDYKLVTTLNKVADKNQNDPDPITVNNPTHMVEQVVQAFKNSSFDLVI